MDNIFANLDTQAGGAVETPVVNKPTGAKEAKKQQVEAMKEALRETLLTDPTYNEKVGTLSSSVEVINSLGFGESGNIVVDKSKKDGRGLTATSAIVGYRVKNIGDKPIKYKTDVWTQGEDGKYVSTRAEKTLEPGGTADFTRMFMTMFCAQPELSFTLANGKIIKGSGSKGNKDLKAELESYYFRFDKDEVTGEKKQINDDTVKLNVGEKVNGVWVVKAEYVETFGFLNNPKENAGRRTRGKSGETYSAQTYAANYINKLITEQGL